MKPRGKHGGARPGAGRPRKRRVRLTLEIADPYGAALERLAERLGISPVELAEGILDGWLRATFRTPILNTLLGALRSPPSTPQEIKSIQREAPAPVTGPSGRPGEPRQC